MKHIRQNVEIEIVGKIAEGGQGAVYKAVQKGVEGFGKTVAIKTLHSGFVGRREFTDMFIAEAKLVANLVHENIVQIYQLGKQDDYYYFILEYVDGVSLYEIMNAHRDLGIAIPKELCVFVASRVARGLAYAHSRRDADGRPLNIVHCDVCPHNILVTSEGLPKLTDFGIAKASSMVSRQTSVSGKLPYMSPEQARMEQLDFRSDLYSLGTVLFSMLAGQNFRDLKRDFHSILDDAGKNIIHWEKLPAAIDSDLKIILEKMLASSPANRFQSTDELARALEYYIYKDGYGPTIVTLAQYLRKELPAIFKDVTAISTGSISTNSATTDNEKTVVIPRPS